MDGTHPGHARSAPGSRRKFRGPWDELDYLHNKLHYWLYARDSGSRARPFAARLLCLLEEVLAEACGHNRYRLLRSPGLVPGVAAEDVFELFPDGCTRVLERGRNISVQIMSRGSLDAIEATASPSFKRLGGRLDLDGRTDKLLVYTVSIDATFDAIERVVAAITSRFRDVEWYYGNVYDPADGVTPLNWWL